MRAGGVALALVAGRPAEAQDLQEKVAAAKQAAAQNQQALRSYTWLEKTEISLKGEVKNTKVESCRYGPDGKVQKTQVSEPPPPQPKKRGLKGKVIEKKTGEMKEEMQTAVALVHQYVPPSPDKIQAAMAAGKITIVPGAGTTALRIADYVKAGDSLVLTLDTAAKGMQKMSVDTWMDSPSDKVTLERSDAVAARRHELRGHRGAGHPVQQDPGPDHEQQLPEARAVAVRRGP